MLIMNNNYIKYYKLIDNQIDLNYLHLILIFNKLNYMEFMYVP